MPSSRFFSVQCSEYDYATYPSPQVDHRPPRERVQSLQMGHRYCVTTTWPLDLRVVVRALSACDDQPQTRHALSTERAATVPAPATTLYCSPPTVLIQVLSMGGPSATQHAPKSLLELEDLLKDDIKVKVAGEEDTPCDCVVFLNSSLDRC